MPTNDESIGMNIQQRRYEVRLSQAEVAASMGLDRTVLSKIEAGSRALTAGELLRLAEILKCSMESLVVPRPDSGGRTPRTVRFRADSRIDADDRHLGWFADLVVALRPGPVALKVAIGAPKGIAPKASGELVARRVRRALGGDPFGPLGSASRVASNFGAPVVVRRMPSRSQVSGASLNLGDGRAGILVNGNHPLARQRFSVCHELAHHLFEDPHTPSACALEAPRPGPRSLAEVRADIFASALLLPSKLAESQRGDGFDLDSIASLARALGMSRPAVVSRLRGLNLISAYDASALRRLTPDRQHSDVESTPASCVISGSLLSRLGDRTLLEGCDPRPDAEVVP